MWRSRSNPVTSVISTSMFLCERRMERIGAAISPGESPAVATWYRRGWNVWEFLRSMIVILTGALAKACAAFKPPKPAPTITTRGVALLVILPFLHYLHKIHRDGRWFQKFFAA